MNRLRQEDGFTLTELLVGAVLMLLVTSASLGVLDQFRALSMHADTKIALQDDARNVSRQLARSLRNLAASPDRPGVVERARPYDIVFRIVDKPRADAAANVRNLKRVRYCLDASNPDSARLMEQTQRWNSLGSPPAPTATGCPGAGWDGEAKLLADHITNRSGVTERPLWTYETATGDVTAVKLNLFLDKDASTRAEEVGMTTGVFLRNQNRVPTATFTATAVGVRHVLLNGSASQDPEGQPLELHWYVDGLEVGRGLVFDYYAATGGNKTIELEVIDPGGLSGRSAPQTAVVQ